MLFSEMPGHLVRRVQQISVAIFAEEMANAGVDLTPVQFAALVAIGETPLIDQATLAGAIAYDRVTIGGVVDRLTEKGLVARRISRTDRRARELELTEAGRAVLDIAVPLVNAVQVEILAPLDPEESRELVRLLAKLAKNGNPRSRAPLKTR